MWIIAQYVQKKMIDRLSTCVVLCSLAVFNMHLVFVALLFAREKSTSTRVGVDDADAETRLTDEDRRIMRERAEG